jgi:outer membrane protein assembly factor BamD
MRIVKSLIICALVIFLAGCGEKPYLSQVAAFKGQSAKKIFYGGQRAFAKKKYDDAIKHFEALDALYPFGTYTKTAQLYVIKAYYKSGKLATAVAAATRYIRLYPMGNNTDYAYYIRGLANFEQHKNWLNKIYTPDPAAHDLNSLKQAYQDFSTLIQLYPQSKYLLDARRHKGYIRLALARHQLEVANFYFRRKAYVAAVNRANYLVKNFPQTPQVKDALVIMVKAYRQLEAKKLANDALRILRRNYPGTIINNK